MFRKLPRSLLCLQIKLDTSLGLLQGHLTVRLLTKPRRISRGIIRRISRGIILKIVDFVHLLTKPRRIISRGIIVKIVDEGSSRLLNKLLQTCVAHVRQSDVLGHGLVLERAVVQGHSEFALAEVSVLHLLMGPHFCQGRSAKTVFRLAGAQKLGLLGRSRLKVVEQLLKEPIEQVHVVSQVQTQVLEIVRNLESSATHLNRDQGHHDLALIVQVHVGLALAPLAPDCPPDFLQQWEVHVWLAAQGLPEPAALALCDVEHLVRTKHPLSITDHQGLHRDDSVTHSYAKTCCGGGHTAEKQNGGELELENLELKNQQTRQTYDSVTFDICFVIMN